MSDGIDDGYSQEDIIDNEQYNDVAITQMLAFAEVAITEMNMPYLMPGYYSIRPGMPRIKRRFI